MSSQGLGRSACFVIVKKLTAVLLCGLIWIATVRPLSAEISIEGIHDKQMLADQATFRIVPADGYSDQAVLNDVPVPINRPVPVAQPGYHELLVERTQLSTGARENRLVRFIVRASERGSSESGLAPWTPFPVIASSTAEFAGATLDLWMPAQFPAGLEMPVIALVRGPNGRGVPVNGTVTGVGLTAFQIRRGFGSAVLPAGGTAGVISHSAAVGGLQAERQVQLQSTTEWISAFGIVSETRAWPENSSIHVVSNLVISAGATLTVGAGTVVKLAPGVEIQSSGKILITGTSERPVVFCPENRAEPWGGFVLRTAAAELQMTGAILTGGGAHPDWFGANPGSGESHRHEQPLIYLANGAHAQLTNCFLVHNAGQAAHGENAFLSMTGCLVQKCISTGQFNGGRVDLHQSAFIEFPADDGTFADADNDALYFTAGTHSISDCLIGWAKDDGIDAGSGGAGEVTVTDSWMESCFHEAFAWSGTGRIIRTRGNVILNCGQGIEAGWNSPDVLVDRTLAIGNLVGARFGDNYEWTYDGFLQVTNSFLLFNDRNVWGRNWDDWTERLDRMDIRGNYLSSDDPNHPTNRLWTATEGPQLSAFLPIAAEAKVGVALAIRPGPRPLETLSSSIPVGLSRFSTKAVTVEYAAESSSGLVGTGTVAFAPGQTIQHLPLDLPETREIQFLQLSLRNAINADVTGPPLLLVASREPTAKLIPSGSAWSYLDSGDAPPQGWTTTAFDDHTWGRGQAELGFGDDDETTVVHAGPSTNRHATIYFRHQFQVRDPQAYSSLTIHLRRDDGAVVYLNGDEVFRSNMPTGQVSHATLALSSSTSETTFFGQQLDPGRLQSGTNTMAVEVHQAAITSSDLSFELELSGSSLPRLQHQAMPGGRFWLYWTDDSYQLEEANAIAGPWHALPGSQSPIMLTASSPRFYRLRQK